MGPRITWVINNVNSDTPIQLFPNWNFQEVDNRNILRQRTVGGRLHTFTKVGCLQSYKLPLTFVGSNDASIINSWWQTQTELRLTINGSFDTSVFSADTIPDIPVRIMNTEKPFQKPIENIYTKFMGVLLLSTI